MITRVVSAGMRGEFAPVYQFPSWQKSVLLALGMLPQSLARFAISRFESISGLPAKVLANFKMDDLIQARLADYADLSGAFNTIVIGSALGGATAYLSLALGAPFLPQTFVLTLRGGAPTGDVDQYLHRSLDSALSIADKDPGLMTIQHYDPVHDGWMTRWVNHLRFKLLSLPSAYCEFIKSRLEPGGTVLFLDCGASWLRYKLGPRSYFQVGGWGGIPPEEFLEGSDRLSRYSRQAGLKKF